MDDPLGFEGKAWCGFGFSPWTAAKSLACLLEVFLASGSVDGSVDTSTPCQVGVGSVHNGIHGALGDVGIDDGQIGRQSHWATEIGFLVSVWSSILEVGLGASNRTAMPTLHFKTKNEMETETERLIAEGWFIYMTWQASEGSWHCIVFQSENGKQPW